MTDSNVHSQYKVISISPDSLSYLNWNDKFVKLILKLVLILLYIHNTTTTTNPVAFQSDP